MWPFDRKKRDEIATRLAQLQQHAIAAMQRDDVEALDSVMTTLRPLVAIEAPEGVLQELDTWAVISRVNTYLANRTKARDQQLEQNMLDRLRPCAMCTGREYHLSEPLWIDELA